MKEITDENIKEFWLRIMNLRRAEVLITEDQVLAVISQILQKEQIKQAELEYFLAKIQAVQNTQIVGLVPQPLPNQIPQPQPEVDLNLEELASFISHVIQAHIAQAVTQNLISLPFAEAIKNATQPTQIAAAMSRAPHQPVPTVLNSNNQNTDTMLNSEVIRTTHQQALEENGNETQQQKAQLVFNTAKPLIEDIGENSSKLIVSKEELFRAVEILLRSIRLLYSLEHQKDQDIHWGLRLVGNKPNPNGHGTSSNEDKHTKEKTINLENSFNK